MNINEVLKEELKSEFWKGKNGAKRVIFNNKEMSLEKFKSLSSPEDIQAKEKILKVAKNFIPKKNLGFDEVIQHLFPFKNGKVDIKIEDDGKVKIDGEEIKKGPFDHIYKVLMKK